MKESCIPTLRFLNFEDSWARSELIDVASIQRGRFSPRPRNNPIYYGGAYPFVQTSDVVKSGGRITEFTQTLNEKGLQVSKMFPKGTILITIAANIGFTGVLEISMACPDSLIGISCKPETYNYFLNYLFIKEQPKMDYLAVEGAQKNINIAFLENYVVATPSLPEQRKIADFLTAVDERIGQLIRKRDLLEEYKKGMMQQLFSQTIRFKDDNGNDFPDWEEREFSEIVQKTKTKFNPVKSNENLPCVELENISQNTGQLLNTFNTQEQKSIKNRFSEGDVLFGKLRPYLRKFLKPEFDGVCSSEIWVLRGIAVSNGFLFYLIQSHKFNQVANVSSGSKMPRSDWDFVSAFPFTFPSSKVEQTKIAVFFSCIDHKIASVATQITETQTFKRGLLQQMFV